MPESATTRLYYTDAYLSAFDANVVAVGDDGRRVYLDRTAFYPTSGGQPHDLGTLAGVEVLDVVDDAEGVAHLLASPLPAAVGDVVRGEIDWVRRFDNMQQHTGQHLLSAVFADRFGLQTVSVHFGATSSTLDLAAPSLERDLLLDAEALANARVWEDVPVRVSFEDAATATGLRKPSERAGELRIVTIEGLDRSACGGTHVRGTAEIGPIALRRVERMHGDTRVEFYCGSRALARARADYELLGGVAQALGTAPENAPEIVAAQREQLREAASLRKRMTEELAGYRGRALYAETEPDAAGVRRRVERRGAGGMEELRPLAQAFTAQPRAVFVGVVEEPPSLVVAASEDAGVDAGVTLRQVLAEAGGRGGGSARVAQGSVPSLEALERVVDRLAG